MALPVEAKDIAAGDWTESWGTIRTVVENRDKKTNELQSLNFTFWNGREEIGIDPCAIFMVVQGGLNDRQPTSTIREGFADDHQRD